MAAAAFDAVYARADAVLAPAARKAISAMGWELSHSPVTAGLPFVDSPTGVLLCLAVYLSVVLAGSAVLAARPAQAAAAKRPDPAWLRSLVLLHNLFLVVLSVYMCSGMVYHAVASGYRVWGNAFKVEEREMATLLYIFFLSKIYEFLDTFIMLLKGNLQQVSLLHVYHHVSMSLIWWMIINTAPGGDAYFSAALNSFVHVIMYSYYLLAAYLGKDSRRREKYLWWGRYLTQFQMLQFLANFVQAAYCMLFFPKHYPYWLSKLLLQYMVSLLALFGSFYYAKHVAPPKKRDVRPKRA